MIATSGCGRPAHQLDTAAVRGTVTLDGQPLPGGYVYVTPSKGRAAKGKIQSDGTFVLGTYQKADGVQVGAHPVTVAPVPSDELGPMEAAVSIPEKYQKARTSGLTIEVIPGDENEVALRLLSE